MTASLLTRFLAFLLFIGCSTPAQAGLALLTTPQGVLAGMQRDDVSAWFGIPYAAPPTGAQRWHPPRPATGWDGVRPAVQYGPLCPQYLGAIEGRLPAVSEDCLTLNVWAPSTRPAKPLPVIVWLHGGGYFQGSASQTPTAGWGLAQRGVVFVSANFRLGALGFLAHPALSAEGKATDGVPHSGNYGLMDQLQALRWVRANIAAFGGDPDNITLMGQSSGAASATTLATLPAARDLIHKLILHSGSVPRKLRHLSEPVGDWTSMEALGDRFAAALRYGFDADPLPKMRATDWRTLEKAWRVTLSDLQGDGTWHHLGLDGWFLKRAPADVFAAGEQAPLPILAGTTADEGSWFARRGRLDSRERFDGYVAEVYGKAAVEPLRRRYAAHASTAQDWLRSASQLLRDQFRSDLAFTADAERRLTPQVWLYEFRRPPGHVPPGRYAELGDYHSAELPYVFDQLLPGMAGDTWHEALADELADRWVAFAKSGAPNPAGHSAWKAYDSATRTVNLAGSPGTLKLDAPPPVVVASGDHAPAHK